jgi:cytochrome P450
MHASSSQATAEIPPHVPGHLVFPFDWFDDPMMRVDPHAKLRELFDYPDVFYSPLHGGHWIASRAKEMFDVLRIPEVFSNQPVVLYSKQTPMKTPPVDMDPPEHGLYRPAYNKIFGPKAAMALEEMIARRVTELIDEVIDDGECEFVDAMARKLPTYVFLELLGLSHDRVGDYLQWTWDFHSGDQALMKTAQDNIFGTFAKLIVERRANPGADLVSQFLAIRIQGEPIEDQRLAEMLSLVLFGGLSTATAGMSFHIRFLAERPALRRQLADNPALVSTAVEELMRHHGVINTVRTLKQDYVLSGIQLKAGEQIMLPLGLYGLDDREREDAQVVDLGFRNGRHALFGLGPHRCAGMHIARLELGSFLKEWMRRIPEFEIKPGETPVCYGGTSMGVSYLPLVFPAGGGRAA